MSKMSKAIAVLGVVAGLGVAAMPLSSYAAGNTDSKQATVQVEVGGGISLEIVDPAAQVSGASLDLATRTLDLGEAKLGGAIVSGALGVKVSTNDPAGYTLKMTAANVNMTGAAGEIAPGTPTDNGTTSAWGFKVKKSGDADYGAWQALDAAGYDIYTGVDDDNTGNTVASATEGDPATQQTDVTFGVNAAATQAEGTYSTQVTFTATVK